MDFDYLVKLGLEKRLEATQAYFSLFEKTLVAAELDRLILGEKDSDKSYKTIHSSNEVANTLIHRAEKMSWIFKYVPFVESVLLCNYLSFGVAEEGSDIDLLIIAEKKRIYLCRFYATILLHLMRMRRHGKKISGRYCLSFYLSEDFLDLSKIEQKPYDVYLAYWFLALKELISFDQLIWGNLLNENKVWLKRYFDKVDLRREPSGKYSTKSLPRKVCEWFYGGWFGDKIEALLGCYFERRAAKLAKSLPENASIVVSEHMQKFHNNDRREFFRRGWEEKLNRLGLFK